MSDICDNQKKCIDEIVHANRLVHDICQHLSCEKDQQVIQLKIVLSGLETKLKKSLPALKENTQNCHQSMHNKERVQNDMGKPDIKLKEELNANLLTIKSLQNKLEKSNNKVETITQYNQSLKEDLYTMMKGNKELHQQLQEQKSQFTKLEKSFTHEHLAVEIEAKTKEDTLNEI